MRRCFSALAVTIVMVSTGCSLRDSRPDGWVHQPSPDVSDADRFEAMVSVHAHARWPDRDFKGFPFMEFRRAISILETDTGPAADSRRRRAIAKLAAHGIERPEFQRAIEALGVCPRALRGVIMETFGDVASWPAASSIELKIVNSDLLAALTKQCRYLAKKMAGGVFTQPAPSFGWEYDFLIPRPMDSIARSLDAQSWDQCPGYFRHAYLVETPAQCCSNANPECDVDCAHAIEPGTSRPKEKSTARGRPYDECLYEHFCVGSNCGSCEWADCLSDFENLLCVETGYDAAVPFPWMTAFADRYDVDYGLACSMRGEIVGNDEKTLSDYGNLHARRLTKAEIVTHGVSPLFEWSWVHVEKTISFHGSHGGGVGRYLKAKQDELGGMVAELACCHVERKCSLLWL